MANTLHRTPLRRPWAVWLAVLIAVFSALAPTVSHALVLARGGAVPMVKICTSRGAQWVIANTPVDSPDGQESLKSLDHCPFCLHTTDRVAPPPNLLPYPFSVLGGQQEEPIWQAFFFVNTTAFSPPSRGPPVHS
jgi:hypothetical protein